MDNYPYSGRRLGPTRIRPVVTKRWLQIAADALGLTVTRIDRHPGSCLGAAYVAGHGIGAFKDLAGVSRYVASGKVFRPDPERTAVYDRAYANFRETYERLKTLYPKLDPTAEVTNMKTGNAA